MADIIPFAFDDALVRVVKRNDETWFVLADVCRVLEHSNPTMAAARLDDDEKDTLNIAEGISSGPGNPNVTIISESGLYALILTSRKPEAKGFRKWVTSEVLPSIRRTGGYQVAAAPMPAYPPSPPYPSHLLSKMDRRWLNQAANGVAQELATNAWSALVAAVEDAALSGYGLTASLQIEKARLFAELDKALRRLGPPSGKTLPPSSA